MKVDRNRHASLKSLENRARPGKSSSTSFLETLSSKLPKSNECDKSATSDSPIDQELEKPTPETSSMETLVQELGRIVDNRNEFSLDDRERIESTLLKLDQTLDSLGSQEAIREAKIIIRTELERLRQQI